MANPSMKKQMRPLFLTSWDLITPKKMDYNTMPIQWTIKRFVIFAFFISVFPHEGIAGTVRGELKKWHTVTIDFQGPSHDELDIDPNPFLDYRLQVNFIAPVSNRTHSVPGFFDGDGEGSETGNVWRVRFTPDEIGQWAYIASFREGADIAIDTDPAAGSSAGYMDEETGTFTITALDPSADGFLKWGRLDYANGYYLKFQDGPYWIKGGTDSPENFLGYSGFDNTSAGPFGIHSYSAHVSDWNIGDPDWGDQDGRGIIGALNYLSSKNVNSIYFLSMNVGGDGQDVWPWVGPITASGDPIGNDHSHFDISKLNQWEIVFEHAQKKGIFLHFVLGEGEKANKEELGVTTFRNDRKLYYREIIARFGHHLALQWNICEEFNSYGLTSDMVKNFADYIAAIDPYNHPITVHTWGDALTNLAPFYGEPNFMILSIQDQLCNGDKTEAFRNALELAGQRVPMGHDEHSYFDSNGDFVGWRGLPLDANPERRKKIIWPAYLSGGIIEYFFTISLKLEDFREFETLWDWSWFSRNFLEQNLPFWEMVPADHLLTGEAQLTGDPSIIYDGQVFKKQGSVYAVYLPDASSGGTLDLTQDNATFTKKWYNPKTGIFEGTASIVNGGTLINLGLPPNTPSEDWLVLLSDGVPYPPSEIDHETPYLASFDGGAEGFTYQDDVFRSTSSPAYAYGNYEPSAGYAGGGLHVSLGGVTDTRIDGMSGGWSQSFVLNKEDIVDVNLKWRLVFSGGYENDECGQALVAVDGEILTIGSLNYLAQFCGFGDGNPDQDSGWQEATISLLLKKGTHTIMVGGWNNKKTGSYEITDIYFDDIMIAIATGNLLPTASFTADMSTPLTVAVNASTSSDDGSIVAYEWNFGDNSTGSGTTALHTYAASGNYTVSLTVTDDDGATATFSQEIAVMPFLMTGCSADLEPDADVDGSDLAAARYDAVEFDPAVIAMDFGRMDCF